MRRTGRTGYRSRLVTRRDVDKLQEEIEELFADLWQVPRFSGPAPRVPAERRLLPHRRPARADGRRRAARASTRAVVQRRRRRAAAPDRGRAQAPAGPGPRLPADGDRVRRRSSGRCGWPRTSIPRARAATLRARRADDRAARSSTQAPPQPAASRIDGRERGDRRERSRLRRAGAGGAAARAAGGAAGAAAEGDGRLPAVDVAARDRPGALGAADRRRRRRRPAARARHRARRRRSRRPGWDDIYEVGTVALVHKMIKVPDGTLRILVQGLERVQPRPPARHRPVPARRVQRAARRRSSRRPSSRR